MSVILSPSDVKKLTSFSKLIMMSYSMNINADTEKVYVSRTVVLGSQHSHVT